MDTTILNYMPTVLMKSMKPRIIILALAVALSISFFHGFALADDPSPFTFAVTADMRYYSGPDYNSSSYFRGAVEAIQTLGESAFMLSPGDIDPVNDVKWTIEQVMGINYLWYPVTGNHELPGAGHEAYFGENMDSLRNYDYDRNSTGTPPDIVNYGPSGCPETTFSFDYENTHFVVLNEYCNTNGDTVTDGDVPDHLYDWLNLDLRSTVKKYIFVFGHEPAFPQPDVDNGRFRHEYDSLNKYPANRDRFWNLLRDNGVIAYICGHTHNYSAYFHDGVWQLDAGHARGEGDSGAASTFLIINVGKNTVTLNSYRDLHDGVYDYDDIIHRATLFNGCPHPVGHIDYCRDCGPCTAGEGDCDNDNECKAGLTCAQVPGIDTCEAAGCPHPVGHLDFCRDCGPCAAGEGDCDKDSECVAGLNCVQVTGTDVCCPHPIGHSDYCRDCGPCRAGQGDCDYNSECVAGLNCVQLDGTDICCPHPIGHSDYCRDCGPCSAGQGDCDNNSECKSGLTCVQVTGIDTCQ